MDITDTKLLAKGRDEVQVRMCPTLNTSRIAEQFAGESSGQQPLANAWRPMKQIGVSGAFLERRDE